MTLEPLHPIQAARLREMTPAEKWNVALGLLRTARETRRAALTLDIDLAIALNDGETRIDAFGRLLGEGTP